MEVTVSTSPLTYGPKTEETIFDNEGTQNLIGFDFGDIETGEESIIKYLYYRHDGDEPIYNCGFFIRAIGNKWGGYVATRPDTKFPFNPNFFRSGGIREDSIPQSSTVDYDFLRGAAYNNPEMGVRLHMDINSPFSKTDGLGFDNRGISSSPITLNKTALDWSRTTDAQVDGKIFPEPLDSSKIGKVGDEAKIGISMKLSEDTVGSGYVQFSIAMKYRTSF